MSMGDELERYRMISVTLHRGVNLLAPSIDATCQIDALNTSTLESN